MVDLRSCLVLSLAVLALSACKEEKEEPDPMDAQIAETCKCLNGGDFLAAMECEQVHADTLAELTDKPEIAKRLKAGVDSCRPEKPGG